jgi:DNA-binding NarL/FixJ family response regulator
VRTARVLVVHPHRIVAEAVARRLDADPGIRTVDVAAGAPSALAAANALGPDVAVVLIGPHQRASLELTERLVERDPPIRVVALLGVDDARLAITAVRAGASAVVTSDRPAAELVDAVHAVASDRAWIARDLLQAVLAELRSSEPPPNEYDERLARLTPREREVLDRLVAGHDRATIARELLVSIGTVRTHTRNVLAKLDVHSSLEAVSVARRGNYRDHRP